jgi:23S rRNA pseudouridine955/2504/2580 synthase/23S rRNA pseudouridine1911/1915/1917 synthase
MKRRSATKVRPQEAGLTILDFLSNRFTYHSRSDWEEQIHSGRLLLNQKPSSPSAILSTGDTVEYSPEKTPEPPVATHYSILFEDESLLIVDKPADLPCHPAGRYFENTLWALLKSEGRYPYLAFMNRIDRETSGIVALAKSPESAAKCKREFEKHDVFRRYLVLVEGRFPHENLVASGYLSKDPASPVRKRQRFYPEDPPMDLPPDAKGCTTTFQRLKICGSISHLAALPETGRVHQIRATLSTLGFPVVGDKLYGPDETIFLRFIQDTLTKADRTRLRLNRQALHASELHLRHPLTKKIIHFTSSLPPDMKDVVDHY